MQLNRTYAKLQTVRRKHSSERETKALDIKLPETKTIITLDFFAGLFWDKRVGAKRISPQTIYRSTNNETKRNGLPGGTFGKRERKTKLQNAAVKVYT